MGFSTRPELAGHHGMVSSTHWLGSAAGMRVLESGGNAFDAAVSAGLVLQVVEPHLNGPGGDLPIILWRAEEGVPRVLCGQGVAPARASIDAFDDLGLDLVPGTGLLAACVPGAFDAWMTLLRDHGTIEVETALEAAIFYAEKGAPVTPQLDAAVTAVERIFREHWPTSEEVFLADGLPRSGSVLRNPALAATYRRVVREANAVGADRDARIEAARECFYRGFIAEAIEDYVATTAVRDSSGRDHHGLISGDDLARWQATYEEPARFRSHGHEFCKVAPWGQGPVMLQQLALLEGFDLEAAGLDSVEYVHTVIECAKLALADREAWYGDPEFVDVPLDALLSSEYSEQRRRLVGTDASFDLRPGAPEGRLPKLPTMREGGPATEGIGEPTVGPVGDTCHVDVVDRHGNLVSATPSGGWLQSSPVIPGLGFPLGTRAQMFWLEEGLASSLAPGKRPRSTLSPTIALDEGVARFGFGTPGGDQQDQWALNFLLAKFGFDLNLQEAIDLPQFHSLNAASSFFPRHRQPGRIAVESRLGAEVIGGLRERGHDVIEAGPWGLGRVCAVSRERDDLLRAGASPRGMHCYAVGR